MTGAYRDQVAEALAHGDRFADLHVHRGRVRTTLVARDGTTSTHETAAEGAPTIVDLVPAAEWDEREAHDRDGVAFAGHEPLRPLLRHDPDPASWTVPVYGVDPYQVVVGPVHAGVIESGHFRFHVVGDRILHVDTRLFYKHRGLERFAAGRSLDDALAVVGRACAACHVTNSVAYAQAVEQLRGLEPTAEVARARTILLELERLWSHLNDLAAAGAGTGLAAGTSAFLALVERARALVGALTGHRFAFGSVAIGGSALEIDGAAAFAARATLERIREGAAIAWRTMLFNRSFMDRLNDVGTVSREDALRGGAAGPALRAAGVAEDARATSPLLAYAGFEPAVVARAAGDVQARLEQRHAELVQCLDLLDRLLDGPVGAAATEPGSAVGERAVARVESPRGATVCVVERDGDRVGRLRLRTGSYANWPVLARCVPGNILPDFPLINKSFELCYACVDR
jgi:Ni,Fe-hydrogenase III large subunit